MTHASTLGLMSIFAAVAACSGEAPPLVAPIEAPGSFDLEAEMAAFEAKASGVLSEVEQRTLLAGLAAHGVAREDVELRGRHVMVEGDMLLDADEVLGELGREQAIEKGYTLSTTVGHVSGFQNCSVYDCGALAPTQHSRLNAAQYQFRRPDTNLTYYLVVHKLPEVSSQRINTIVSHLGQAALRITGASPNDCLSAANVLFQTLTATEYQQLANPIGTQHYVTTVVPYISTSPAVYDCGEGATACTNLPGVRPFSLDNKTIGGDRHRFGNRIHINVETLETVQAQWVAAGQPATGGAVGVLLHELVHTLGLGHSGESGSSLLVPGTSSSSNPNFNVAAVPANRRGSVMRSANSDMDRWTCLAGETGLQCLPLEDELLITKLYGSSCAFNPNFRNVN